MKEEKGNVNQSASTVMKIFMKTKLPENHKHKAGRQCARNSSTFYIASGASHRAFFIAKEKLLRLKTEKCVVMRERIAHALSYSLLQCHFSPWGKMWGEGWWQRKAD